MTVALLAVALGLALLWVRAARRERDGARETALQAKQGWDAANDRETNAVLRLVATTADRDLWMDAARKAMDRELELLNKAARKPR